ncbi:MAG: hypothetical protein QGI10_13665 [Vicinamibacterales bacterium]|nr:hypothetical protein [Vicinamibacterales bacterium]HJN45089.1 hypothetical protein [Vicinamibacterales bacterium]
MSTGRLQIWRWEAINRHEGQLYLRRLRVVSCRWFGIYIHWFHASDDDCLHDHPWAFLTFILQGGTGSTRGVRMTASCGGGIRLSPFAVDRRIGCTGSKSIRPASR